MIIIRIRIRSHCLQPKVPFFPTCNVAGYIFHGEEVELTVGEAGLAAEVLGVLAGLDQKGLQDQLLEQEELPDGLVLQQARPPPEKWRFITINQSRSDVHDRPFVKYKALQ